jgi:threonine/homoserine/homoserine lactone efflux protein
VSAAHAIAFLLFAVVAAITPGPSNLLLTSTGAAVGILRGLPALVGQVLGMGLLLFLVAVGLGSLVLRSPLIIAGLKWGGSGVLLWLAWKIATAGPSAAPEDTRGRIGFWAAAAFQWVNPKAWLVCAAAVGTYAPTAGGTALRAAVALAVLFIVAALPSCFVWLAAGASVQRVLRAERAARRFNLTMAALLVGSILLFIR